MKLITRDTDYAVRALVFMARQKDGIVSVSKLVEELRIPRPFLRKILQVLNKKGILNSHKGAGGGFGLARPAKKILLEDLIEIYQGPFRLNECMFKKRACPERGICALKREIDNIERYVASGLRSIAIADLAKKAKGGIGNGNKESYKNRRRKM